MILGYNEGECINISNSDLFEVGKRLVFRNSDQWKVGRFGRGRFTFYEGMLYFSASDNLSIFENDKEYVLRVYDCEEYNDTQITYPSDIGIEITNICNAKCVYCPLY